MLASSGIHPPIQDSEHADIIQVVFNNIHYPNNTTHHCQFHQINLPHNTTPTTPLEKPQTHHNVHNFPKKSTFESHFPDDNPRPSLIPPPTPQSPTHPNHLNPHHPQHPPRTPRAFLSIVRVCVFGSLKPVPWSHALDMMWLWQCDEPCTRSVSHWG
jgi:hypothetical protein